MSSQIGAGVLTPSPYNKNGTKVPTPEGYKQTKVGVIPEEWDVVRFNYFKVLIWYFRDQSGVMYNG